MECDFVPQGTAMSVRQAAAIKAAKYGTFRLNFHRFDRFELDFRGHTQP